MNEERNAEILRLWNMDISAKEVGIRLGLTKNVVIGVVTRLRGKGLVSRQILKGPKECGKQESKRPHEGYVKKEPVFKIRPVAISKTEEKQKGPIVGLPLDLLGHRSCRYPTSRVNEQHYFCGETTRDTATSYCSEHHGVVWQKRKRLTPDEAAKMKKRYAQRQWLNGASAAQLKGKL